MMISQRSAVLNKDVLSQIQVLVTLCTIAPQDLKALEAWIDVHGTQEQRDTLMWSLPALPRGDAWWWSPGWPTDEGIFTRERALSIDTFDSGATPKPGEKRAEPKRLADVDLEALKRQMADTIERAKAEDPKLLRKRVADLEKDLVEAKAISLEFAERAHDAQGDRVKELERQLKEALRAPKVVERAVVKTEQVARLERTAQHLSNVAIDVKKHSETLAAALRQATAPAPTDAGAIAIPGHPMIGEISAEMRQREVDVQARRNGGVRASSTNGKSGLSKCGRALLVALVQRPPSLTRPQLATLSGYSISSSTFSNGVSEVSVAGYVAKEGDKIAITSAGLVALGDPPYSSTGVARTGFELRELWKSKVGRAARTMVDVLHAQGAVTRDDLAGMSGYSVTSSTFSNAVSELNTCGIIRKDGSTLSLVEELR